MSSNNYSSNGQPPSIQSTPSMAHRSKSTPFPPGNGDTDGSSIQRPGQPGQFQFPPNCPCLVYTNQRCCPLCCSPVGQQGSIHHSPFCPCTRARQHPIPYGQPQPAPQYPPMAGSNMAGGSPSMHQPSMANNPGQYSYQSPQIGANYPQPPYYQQQNPYQYGNNGNGRPMTAPPGSGPAPGSSAYPPLQPPPGSRDADLHAPITRYWFEQNLPHYMKQMELQGIFRSCYCHTNPGPPELRDTSSVSSTASSVRPGDSQSSIGSSMVAQPSSSEHQSVASSHGGFGGEHGQGHPPSQHGSSSMAPTVPSKSSVASSHGGFGGEHGQGHPPSQYGSPSMAPTAPSKSSLASSQSQPSAPSKQFSKSAIIAENTPMTSDHASHQKRRNHHGHYPRQLSKKSSNSSSSMGDSSISSSMSSSTNREPSIASSASTNPSNSNYSSSTYRDPSVSSSVSSSIAPSDTRSMSSMGSSMAPSSKYDPSQSQSSKSQFGPIQPPGRPTIEMKCYPHQLDPMAYICYPQEIGSSGPGPGPGPGPMPVSGPPPGFNLICFTQPQNQQAPQGSQAQNPRGVDSSSSVATSHGGQYGQHGQGHPTGPPPGF